MWRVCAPVVLATLSIVATLPSQAANTPCSGRKGGISHCQGDIFICNDGSTSASKRSCTAYMGGSAQLVPRKQVPATAGDCSCRSGSYCTGPRGGTYCYSDSGRKSYLRKR